MNYGGLLRRAGHITWNHRLLWWLWFLLLPSSMVWGYTHDLFTESIFRGNSTIWNFWGFIPPGFSLVLLANVPLWLLATIGRGGIIGATDLIEETGGVSFDDAWKAGSSNLWGLLGVVMVSSIPQFIMSTAATTVSPLGGGVSSGAGLWISVSLMGTSFLIWGVAVFLRPFAERACVFETTDILESYRRAWEVLKTDLRSYLVLLVAIPALAYLALYCGYELLVPLLNDRLESPLNDPYGIGVIPLAIFSDLSEDTMLLIVLAAVVVTYYLIQAVFWAFSNSLFTLAYRQFADRSLEAVAEPILDS